MIKLQIIGNLGRDAEMRIVGEKHYISYSVCHTEKGKDGREFSTWVDVMQSSRDAEPKLLQYLKKGSSVYVEGNPSVGAYKDNEGNAKASLSLWAFKMEFAGGRRNEEPRENRNEEPTSTRQSPQEEDDSDLPF